MQQSLAALNVNSVEDFPRFILSFQVCFFWSLACFVVWAHNFIGGCELLARLSSIFCITRGCASGWGAQSSDNILAIVKTFLVLLLHRTCFSSDSLGIRRIRCLRSRRSAQAWQILGFPQNATFHVIEFETQGGMFCMFVAFMPKSHPSDHMQYDINLYANASSIGTAHARITVGLYTTRALNAMRPACSRVCS